MPRVAKIPLQRRADLGELGEDQRALAAVDQLLHHLPEPLELVGALGREGAAILQELRRVVADLLEPQERGQDQAPALDALRLLQLLCDVLDDGLVEGRLLGRERAIHLLLDLVRQIVDDPLVGLDAAQDEGLHQLLQGHRPGRIVALVDGHLEGLAELGLLAQVAGIEEVEDRPEIAQAVLDGRAGQGQAMRRRQLQDRARLGGLRILDVLGLVDHHAVPVPAPQELLVQARQRERGQDDIVRLAGRREAPLVFDRARCPDAPACGVAARSARSPCASCPAPRSAR